MSWTVVSPHLDDAVFGCGDWLALHPGALVVTVFAGRPATTRHTDWDARCGFCDSDRAMASRCDEDRRALARLDSQYREPGAPAAIARALQDALGARDPARLIVPLGLFHSDHVLAHSAAVAALAACGIDSVLAYEDTLYRGLDGLLQARLSVLRERGVEATPAREQPGGSSRAKQEAVGAYASQLRAFGPHGFDDLGRPERLWRLTLRRGDVGGTSS